MYLSASSQGWFHAIGGWPNLLAGLLSAVITGFVAALVSLTVVKLTNDGARKLYRRQEARDKLVEAVESTIGTFLGVPDSRPWRKDLEDVATLNFKLSLAAALVAEQDAKIAQRVQDVADELAKVAENWQGHLFLQEDSEAPRRYNEAYDVVKPLQDEIVNWLGNINPIPRDSHKDDDSSASSA